MPAGRPTDYCPEVVEKLCAELADGRSMRSVCSDQGMPNKSTVFKWLRMYPEFKDQYEIAKQEAADCFAEEIIEIADDGTNDWMEKQNKDGSKYEAFNAEHVQRSRLRVDARKWTAAKLKPKKYGDKVSQQISGPDGGPIQAIEWTVLPVKPIDQVDEADPEG